MANCWRRLTRWTGNIDQRLEENEPKIAAAEAGEYVESYLIPVSLTQVRSSHEGEDHPGETREMDEVASGPDQHRPGLEHSRRQGGGASGFARKNPVRI